MGRFLTTDDFIAQFGEAEARQIAGSGNFNSLEGSQIDRAVIDAEIAFTDDLIAGYVLARHSWVGGLDVADVPSLLKGLGGDIVRYRLRDKAGGKGQVSDTVETRYRDALKRLEAIGAGKLGLSREAGSGADAGGVEVATGGGDAVCISGPPPQSDNILRGY